MQGLLDYSGWETSDLLILIEYDFINNDKALEKIWTELYDRFQQNPNFGFYEKAVSFPYMLLSILAKEASNAKPMPSGHQASFDYAVKSMVEYLEGKRYDLKLKPGRQAAVSDILLALKQKVKDPNALQKVIRWSEEMEKSRQLALPQGETEKESATTALTAVKEKKLGFTLSKLKKDAYMDLLAEARQYQKEDRRKIMVHGMKRYPEALLSVRPWECFVINLVEPVIEFADMIGLLATGLKERSETFTLSDVMGSSTPEEFIENIKKWFFTAEGATDELWERVYYQIARSMSESGINRGLFYRLVKEDIQKHQSFFDGYQGKSITELLEDTIKTSEDELNKNPPKVNHKKSGLAIVKYKEREVEATALRRINNLLLRWGVYQEEGVPEETFPFDVDLLNGDQITWFHPFADEEKSAVKKVVGILGTVSVDESVLKVKASDRGLRDQLNTTKQVYTWLRHKFLGERLSDAEIKFLYATEGGKAWFHKVSHSYGNLRQETLKDTNHFVEYNLNRAMPFFSFANENERKLFFSLNFSVRGMMATENGRRMLHAIAEKVQNEVPETYSGLVSLLVKETSQEAQMYTTRIVYHSRDNWIDALSDADKRVYLVASFLKNKYGR